MYNRSPVFLDFYDDYKYTNGNTWVGGSSGAGKTFTLQTVGGRLRQQGKQVIYIVPKKGHEFRPLCEEIGGQFIRLSPSSPDCINIMEIRRTLLDTIPLRICGPERFRAGVKFQAGHFLLALEKRSDG
jgi:type IV secretory pathway VirB4 component